MKYLKTYKLFEADSFNLETIKDILLELEDDDFTIQVNPDIELKDWFFDTKIREWRYNSYTEIIITRRVLGHNGGLSGFEFIWRDIKDTIFRLMDYYYLENEAPEINNNKIVLSNSEKREIKELYSNSPFRLFGHIRNGFAASDRMVEFGIGFTSEEDFDNAEDNSIINDYTIFEKVKILIKG